MDRGVTFSKRIGLYKAATQMVRAHSTVAVLSRTTVVSVAAVERSVSNHPVENGLRTKPTFLAFPFHSARAFRSTLSMLPCRRSGLVTL
jgi:hypothetical protein